MADLLDFDFGFTAVDESELEAAEESLLCIAFGETSL